MTKLISTLLAAIFAAATISPVAFAADDKGEPKKEQKKEKSKDGKKKAAEEKK